MPPRRRQLRHTELLFALLAAASAIACADEPTSRPAPPARTAPKPEAPIKCKVGLTLNDIGNLDFNNGSFKVHGLAWMNWVGKWEDCLLLPVNADEGSLDELRKDSKDDRHYRLMRIKGSFLADFDLKRYPFDRQTIEIHLENPLRGTGQLDIVAEPAAGRGGPAAGLAKGVRVPGWTLTAGETLERTHTYNFGLGTGKPVSHEQFVYRVQMRRNYLSYVFRAVLPLSVIVAVVFLGFLLPALRIDVSVGLVVTCLLAAIALHLTQASSMPNVGFLVAGDYPFMVAYVLLFLALAERILSFRIANGGDEAGARRLNRGAVIAFPAVFLTTLFGVIAYFMR